MSARELLTSPRNRRRILALILALSLLSMISALLATKSDSFGSLSLLEKRESRNETNLVQVSFHNGNQTLADLDLEVANTTWERRKGLMGRKRLTTDGMFFKFPREKKLSFWMRDTYLPLDIIFISKDGRVVNVKEADPEPGTAEENLTSYYSQEPAQYVVETRRGLAEDKQIVPGVSVDWRLR